MTNRLRQIEWPHVVLALSGMIAFAIVAVAIVQPELPGRWCANDTQWLVCYREWLIPASGFFAASGAVGLILFERNRAKEAERKVRLAARMRAASELASLSQEYIEVVQDMHNFEQSHGNAGRLRYDLPVPTFAGSARDIEDMPEVQEVLEFAQRIVETNQDIRELRDDGIMDLDELTTWIQQRAARAALRSIDLHDELAASIRRRVRWNNFPITDDRKGFLQNRA